jgi:hypothetical protein
MSGDLMANRFHPGPESQKWSVIAAVNSQELLQSCLLQSPELNQARDQIWQKGYSSAARAYNAAMDQATTDVLVFAHQDVFLPAGWIAQVQKSLAWLAQHDPHWGVAGIWGVQRSGARFGHVYCTGLGQELGGEFAAPVEVRTVDELLLIVRKSSGLRFDERLSGYHLYGTDICLEAERQGMKCYALAAFCIHNTNGYNLLPPGFWRNYLFLRRKWRDQLPIITPCTEITVGGWPMIRWNVVQTLDILRGKHKPGRRVNDPRALYGELALARHLGPPAAGNTTPAAQ